MSVSVHTLVGCKILVQIKYSVLVRFSVYFNESGQIPCSVSSVPMSELHSRDYMFKSVRRLYQSEISSCFCPVFACTLVAVGTRCCVFRHLYLFFLIRYMSRLGSLVISFVDVSVQSSGVLFTYMSSNCFIKLCSHR